MIRLALYKRRHSIFTPRGIGDALIRWWTRSPYSHCELEMDGVCYSSSIRDGGVRRKAIDLRPDRWDVLDLTWASRDAVTAHWELTVGQKYDWLGLIGSQVLNRGRHLPAAAFCSEWCAEALGLSNPQTYSPQWLADYCRRRTA